MLRRGIEEGQTNHNVSMGGVLEQVSNSNYLDDINEKIARACQIKRKMAGSSNVDDDAKVSAHTSPAPEETIFFEPFSDLDLTMGEEGRIVQAEAHAAIQMVLHQRQHRQRHHHHHSHHQVVQPSFRAFAEI